MDTDNQRQLKQTCLRIALLMEHQEILPDLKDIISHLLGDNSPEYMLGATDALTYLISFLEQKGCPSSRE